MAKIKFKKSRKTRKFSRRKALIVQKNYYACKKDRALKKLTIEMPIFACWSTTGTGSYQFNETTGTGTPTLLLNLNVNNTAGALIYEGFFSTDEYIHTAKTYALVSFKGLSLSFKRSFWYTPEASAWLNLPDIYIAPVVDTTNTLIDKDTAPAADNALRVQVLNEDGRGVSKYYAYPPVVSVTGGYSYGAQVYIPTVALRSGGAATTNWVQEIVLGFLDAPINNIGAPAAGYTQKVGTITATLYCEFMLNYSLQLLAAP